ncbi:substrate-binding periplasmic protein [Pseudodesulfovibrio sp.]|uniref:substrate-binding periplasmic protein n=1 Tax=unclassified Pseudodesulfovibrio TaxID=2661612 RepID=UPI003B00222E
MSFAFRSLIRRFRIVLPFFLTIVFSVLAALPSHAFTVGYFILEPHAMVVDGSPTGAAVEYLRDHIAPEMGETVEFLGPLPFGRMLDEFMDGKLDAVLMLSRTQMREALFVYPKSPYGIIVSGLLVPRGSLPDPVTSVVQLAGLRIGSTDAWRPDFLRDPSLDFELVRAPSATCINFRKYREGRLDAVYNTDRHALLYRMRRMPGLKASSVVTVAGTSDGMYTVFSPRLPRHIVSSYEKALEKVRRHLPYEQLVDRYMAE